MNPHLFSKRQLLSFKLSVYESYTPLCKFWCITRKRTSFICLLEKRAIQLYEGAYLKKYKYESLTRLLQNLLSFTSSLCVFEYTFEYTYIYRGRHLSGDLLFPSRCSNSKPDSVQPGHFHVGSRKQGRDLSAVPHWYLGISDILYNNYAAF